MEDALPLADPRLPETALLVHVQRKLSTTPTELVCDSSWLRSERMNDAMCGVTGTPVGHDR